MRILRIQTVLLAVLIVGSLMVASGSAQDMAEAPTKSNKVSVSDFVTPDGRFDLEAARKAGFEGSLDLEGFDVSVGPGNGEPIVSSSGSSGTLADDPDDQYWHDLGVPDVGMSGAVYSMIVLNGELIAGGEFTTAGGVDANYIARFNGISWRPIGSGLDGSVLSLTVYNDELIAGGTFTTAGEVSANHIARWDGSTWQPLGSGPFGPGMNGPVYALTVYNDKLIAGGSFTTAGRVAAYNIASWDGTAWSALGPGMSSGWVYALTVYNGELIVGGHFSIAGGTFVWNIASWDGSSWSALGSGMINAVLDLTVYDGQLIAGGYGPTLQAVSQLVF